MSRVGWGHTTSTSTSGIQQHPVTSTPRVADPSTVVTPSAPRLTPLPMASLPAEPCEAGAEKYQSLAPQHAQRPAVLRRSNRTGTDPTGASADSRKEIRGSVLPSFSAGLREVTTLCFVCRCAAPKAMCSSLGPATRQWGPDALAGPWSTKRR